MPHSGNYGNPGNTRLHGVLKLPGSMNTSDLGYVRLFNNKECMQLRRGRSEEWRVRWDKGVALNPGEWGSNNDKISGGRVIKELKAVNEGSKEMSVALLLLNPSEGVQKTKKDEAEEENDEEEDGEGGGGVAKKRKARGAARAGSKKRARSRGSGGEEAASAAVGAVGAVLDEKEMKRILKEQLARMSAAERAKLVEDVNSGDI